MLDPTVLNSTFVIKEPRGQYLVDLIRAQLTFEDPVRTNGGGGV
jgi:hypothetical protein